MIVVTGGTGFVGRRLMRLLVERYGAENIVCLAYDRTDESLEKTGRAILDELGVRYIPIELVSGRGLDKAPKAPDMVFHLASNTDTGSTDHRVNDVGMRNLLDALQLGPNSHFLFTSTIAVSDHRANPSAPVNEETPLLTPFNDYGRRKLAAEKMLYAQAARDGFAVTILRLSAVYGRGSRQEGLYDSLSKMVKAGSLLSRLDFPGTLSFISAQDIARLLVRFSEEPATPGHCELYIPVVEVMTIAQLLALYHEAYGKPYRPIHMPRLLWRTADLVTQGLFRLEPLMPHWLINRFWQIGLVVGNGFHNASDKTQRRLPDMQFDRVRDLLPDMIR